MIDSINDLLKAGPDTLDEMLLDSKYNKANLRELIRRLIKEMQEWKAYIKRMELQQKEPDEILERIKELINKSNN